MAKPKVKGASCEDLFKMLESAFSDLEYFAWDNFPDALDAPEREDEERRVNEDVSAHKAALGELRLRLSILNEGRK